MSIPVRLQKYLADQGIASRRQAEVFIEEGRVEVNGETAQLGQKVMPDRDRVTLDGQQIRAKTIPTVVLAMHKPRGVLCSNDDPHHERTVFDLLPPFYSEYRLFCAGRLDKDSEGLLILTNDGALSQRLTHPSNNVIKRYHVTVNKPFDSNDIRTMLNGITYEGERLQAEKVIPETRGGMEGACRLEIHLRHGRKREIRRLLEALGYFVKRLKRFQIGAFKLRGIGPGSVKELGKKDIALLFSE